MAYKDDTSRYRKEHLKEHFLVKKYRKDGEREGVVSVTGYVGNADLPGHIRLYKDLLFDEYVEVPDSDILRAAEVPDDELQFGGTRVWISYSTELTVKTGREKPQVISGQQYFKGEVADRFIESTRELKYDWVGKREMLMLGSSDVVCFNTCIDDGDDR